MPGPNGTALLDNFNRADEFPIATNWTTPSFSDGATGPDLVNNVGDFNPGAAHYDLATFGPDCEVWLTATLTFGSIALRARMSGVGGVLAGGSYYQATFDVSGQWILRKVVSGSTTDLTDLTAFTWTNGDQVGLVCNGTSIQAWRKPAAGSWAMLGSQTDSSITTAGYLGVSSDDGGCTIDDFGGGTLGQTVLPDADLAAGGWTTTPLFSKVNDASDSTVITATAS